MTEEFCKPFLKTRMKRLAKFKKNPSRQDGKRLGNVHAPESFSIKSDFVGINPPAVDEIATR